MLKSCFQAGDMFDTWDFQRLYRSGPRVELLNTVLYQKSCILTQNTGC